MVAWRLAALVFAFVLGLAGAGPRALEPSQGARADTLWHRLGEGGQEILRDLKERARPRIGDDGDDRSGRGQRAAQGGPAAQSPLPNAEADAKRAVAAPSFTRLTIVPRGPADVEGRGTPGSRIVLSSGGRRVGSAQVTEGGVWRARLDRTFGPGVHWLEVSAEQARRGELVAGADLRIAIPAGASQSIVIGDIAPASSDPARDLAEAMAHEASGRFSEILTDRGSRRPGTRLAQDETARPASDGAPSSAVAQSPVRRWLERSAETYQRQVIPNLSAPSSTTLAWPRSDGGPPVPSQSADRAAPAAGPGLGERLSEQALTVRDRVGDWLARANRTYQGEVAARLKDPPVAGDTPSAQPQRGPEPETEREQRSVAATTAPPPAETAPTAPADDQQVAERRRREDADQQEAEARRLAEEQQRREAETQRLAEERQAEEKRRAAEVERRAEEQRRTAEAERQAEEKRRTAEAEQQAQEKRRAVAKLEEAKRLAEEAARKEAERRRIAEDKRAAEAARKSREAAAEPSPVERPEDEQEADVERLATNLDRRLEPADEPPRRKAAAATEGAVKSARRKPRDPRPVEGSAEGDEAEEAGRPKSCRPARARRVKGMWVHRVVRGDTLWGLAERYYGSGSRYAVIYRANQDRLRDPDTIVDCRYIYVPKLKR